MIESVCQIVREAEENYVSGTTDISKYVAFDMFETINTIDAYLFSKHLSGETDILGREKPFYNVVIAARNIWFRATDIDRKDIRLTSAKSNQVILTLVANILLKRWMKKAAFGVVLNDWGRTLATYGSAVLKFVEKDGELFCTVIPWNRLVPDVIDFENNVKIEVLEFTPAQLRKQKNYDQDMVEALLNSKSSREGISKQKKDNKANYIKVYEVHGELPKSLLTDKDSDEDIYIQQMHAVSFVRKDYNRSSRTYDYDDFTLYSGKEKEDPYFITHLIKEDGRTLAIGAVENLFQSQWMTNHSVKLEKDVLDLASLIITQTSDPNLAGMNSLRDLVSGDIIIHAENQPLTQFNNQHDIVQIQNFGMMWQELGKEIVATRGAISNDPQKAGTAWRAVEAQRQESHSLFEIMRQNKGLAIEEMLRKFIIPFLKTKMDTSEEITDILEDQDLAQFDSIYIPKEAIKRNNKRIKETILSGQIADNGDLTALEDKIKGELAPLGNQRFVKVSDIPTKTWKDLLKDFEWEPEVNITEESVNTTDTLATLNTLLQTAVNDPVLYKFLIGKILETTGQISPVEIPASKPPQQISPMAAGQKQPLVGVKQ